MRTKESRRVSNKKWRDKNPDKIKCIKLRQRYGLTLEQFNTILELQEKRCAICKEIKDLHVDHDHLTKKIRGLLCGNCNRALGLFKDNLDTLQQAIEYLDGIKQKVT